MGPRPGTIDIRSSTGSQWSDVSLTSSVPSISPDPEVDPELENNNITVTDPLLESTTLWHVPSPGDLQAHSPGAHYIVRAVVSGFVPIRRGGGGLGAVTEMAFVIEVTWSDGRTHMVKRTFSDFCNFHFYLLEEWADKGGKDGLFKLTLLLPGQYLSFISMYFFFPVSNCKTKSPQTRCVKFVPAK